MPGVRLHEISWVVKRKEPRPTAKVPKCVKWKGCGISKTTRMLAQKQPHIKRVRNSSLVERSPRRPGLNTTPKLRNSNELVEEH